MWLFGSRARGDATPDSDWDLFVVIDDSAEEDELDPGVGRRLRRECGVRADVIPWRASEFAEFRRTPNTLAYSVAREGVLLHELPGQDAPAERSPRGQRARVATILKKL